MQEQLGVKDRARLEDLCSMARWDGDGRLKEAVTLAMPIFADWMDTILNEELRFISIRKMFANFDPTAPFAFAEVDTMQGPLMRVHSRYQAHKDAGRTSHTFARWLVQYDGSGRIEDVLKMPQDHQAHHKVLINRFLDEMLEAGLDLYRQGVPVTVPHLIKYMDPFTFEMLPQTEHTWNGPLYPVFSHYQQHYGEVSTFMEYLETLIEDDALRTKLQEFPSFEEFLKKWVNAEVDRIIPQFRRVSGLFLDAHGYAPKFAYLMRTVDLEKDYSSVEDLPVWADRGTFFATYLRVSRGFAADSIEIHGSYAGSSDDTELWFVGCIEDPEKRLEIEDVLRAGEHYDERIRDVIREAGAKYIAFAEEKLEAGEFISFRRFIRYESFESSDPTISTGEKLHTWIAKNYPGNMNTALGELLEDEDLKARLASLPDDEKVFWAQQRLDIRVEELNSVIDEYRETAQWWMMNQRKPLTLNGFLASIQYADDGTPVWRNGYGKHAPIYHSWSRRSKEAGDPSIFHTMFDNLSEENREIVGEIPQDQYDFYEYIINKYIERYLEWAEEGVNITRHGTFKLWFFFSDMDPEKPFEEARCASRGGPWHKMITWYTQKGYEYEDAKDFDDWVMQQIHDEDILEQVRQVPRDAEAVYSIKLAEVMHRYPEFAALNMYKKLHEGKSVKGIRLSPMGFVGKSDFDTGELRKGAQQGSLGTILRAFFKMKKDAWEIDGEDMGEFDDWLYELLPEEQATEFATYADELYSDDPDIQGDAFKRYYPLYLMQCRRSGLDRKKTLQPRDFAKRVFPEFYAQQMEDR